MGAASSGAPVTSTSIALLGTRMRPLIVTTGNGKSPRLIDR